MTLFNMGRIVATPGALAAFTQDEMTASLDKHAAGDWGVMDDEDVTENLYALANGARLMSAYHPIAVVGSECSEKLWIITEADRSVTTLLLPSEY